MKRAILLFLFLFACGSGGAQQASISLSRVDPPMSGLLPYNYPISFYFKVTNPTSYEFDEITNSFRIYSPDGATWSPGFTVDTLIGGFPVPTTLFDTTWYGEFLDEGIPFYCYPGNETIRISWQPRPCGRNLIGVFWAPRVSCHSHDGLNADTMWFTGSTLGEDGMLGIFLGFAANPAWVIRIRSIDSSSVGRTICIDSSFFRPSGTWLWSADNWTGHLNVAPEWDGPHCFTITDCCVGRRGNVDLAYPDINIADLTALLRQLYSGWEQRCPAACNVDGDAEGTVDMSDLVYLVDYMFKGGPEPPACP